MRTLSILNFKGGTGKTSLAVNLSHALALQGKRVLVIDADRQANVSSTLLDKPTPLTFTQVLMEEIPLEQAITETRENLYLVPSDTNLDRASKYLTVTNGADEILRDGLAELSGFDYVFFDHAGAYTPVMHTALLASSEMLVPCELEPYATQGLFNMFDKLKRELRKHAIRNTGIIPYNVDLRYTMARQYHKELRETFGELITSVVRTDSTVPRAQSVRQTVFEYDPKSRAAEDYRTLAEDLIAESQGVPS
jgi:chromosome partitioning protein